jgi:hypothetical protein
LRSTDLLPAFGKLESPGFGRGFFVASNTHEDGATWLARALASTTPAWLALYAIESYARPCKQVYEARLVTCDVDKAPGDGGNAMRRLLLILGLLALAIGLLWIGQGLGVINWPQSSFMIRQMQWAGYGAALAALGLILIWQSKR